MKVFISNLRIDTRGGDTGKGLAVKLHKLSRTIELALLLIVTCVLHAINCMT